MKVMNKGYQTASKKYREQNPEGASGGARSASSSDQPASTSGIADFASLFNSMGGGREGGGAPDLSSVLNNPMLMSMAQQMASSGAFNDIMNNPRIREMAQGLMSGERNIGDIVNDPAVQNMFIHSNLLLMFRARQFGAGGGGGSGGNAGHNHNQKHIYIGT